MITSYNFSNFQNQVSGVESKLKNQLALIRTGRANPALLEEVKIDYYGSKTSLKHAAAITAEDARTLRVQPWDASIIAVIENAIRSSSLGLQPVSDKNGVRVILPELTEERRKTLAKLVKEKLEESRISLRRMRDEVWKDIQEKARKKEISEDDKFRWKDKLQEITDEANKKFEEIIAKKEEEIMA